MQTNIPFVFEKTLGPTNLNSCFVLEIQDPDYQAYDFEEDVIEFRLGRERTGGNALIVTRSDGFLSSGRPQVEVEVVARDVVRPGSSVNRITVWCDPAVQAWRDLQHGGRYPADLNRIGPIEATPLASGRVTIVRETSA
jgi:hypothetical protein